MATRDLAVKIFGDSSDINRAFNDAGGGAQTMGSRFQGMATKVAGVGVALGGAAVIAKGFADAAGDLGEAQSKANVIFGDGADQVSVFAEGASQALGLSERAATDFASSFGQLLKSTGAGEDAVAGMATELTALTADLGSFNNLASDDVAQKLLAGLGGEAEPLKQLGIFINAASVEAKALEMGLGDVNGVLTEQEKIQARYALILEQTGDAQGDFERTSDGLANSQKILGAEWENMQAVIGEKLAPVFAEFFGWLAETMPQVIDWLGPKMTAAGEMLSDFWEDKGPAIMEFIGGIGAVIEALWPVVEEYLGYVVETVEGLFTAFEGVYNTIKGLLEGDFTLMIEGIKGIFEGAFKILWTWIEGLGGTFMGYGADIMGWIGDGIAGAVGNIGQALWDALPGPVKWALELGASGLDALLGDGNGGNGGVGDAGGAMFDPIAYAENYPTGATGPNGPSGNTTINVTIQDVSGQGTQGALNEAARAGFGGPG